MIEKENKNHERKNECKKAEEFSTSNWSGEQPPSFTFILRWKLCRKKLSGKNQQCDRRRCEIRVYQPAKCETLSDDF